MSWMADNTYQIPKRGNVRLTMIQSMVPELIPTHSVCNFAEVYTAEVPDPDIAHAHTGPIYYACAYGIFQSSPHTRT